MYSQLEEYLKQVAVRLSALPVARREDEIQEMRQHLLNAVAVSREHGQAEDQAVASVLAQFGAAEEAGRNVVWAWRRDVRKQSRRFSWRFAAIWTVFYVFMAITTYSHDAGLVFRYHDAGLVFRYHDAGLVFRYWAFSMLLPLSMLVLQYLPPKYLPVWLYRWLGTAR